MAFATKITNDELQINLSGISVWAAFTKSFTVPFLQIKSVTVSRGVQPLPWWLWRIGVTNFKWHRYGRFWRNHRQIFAKYSNSDRPIVIITLTDDARFSHIILQPTDVERFAKTLRTAANVN